MAREVEVIPSMPPGAYRHRTGERPSAHDTGADLVRTMALRELRTARHTTQENLAQALHVNQAAISKLEHRHDMFLSTLRSYIEAMGGELEIIARFDDESVRLKQPT